MSGLRGIAKNLSALFSSHAIAVLQQVGLVPLFIHVYGKAGYGQWLALSAAVSYLGTLDFGVQTFVNQDLTVRYHRGDMNDFHINQSTALWLLLGIVCTVAALATVVFWLPLQHILKMDGVHGDPIVSPRVVQLAVYFMALQALATIIYGYFAGTFMVLGKAYIGTYWNNAKLLLLISTAVLAAILHASFAAIAIAQFAGLILCLIGELWHLRRIGRHIFPTLQYWDHSLVADILRPSGYFALIYSSNFLVYQVPILILQRTAGGSFVTLFSLMRTIFSMTRNMLNALTQSIGPEITSLFAKHDWKGLSTIYEYSERLIFATIPVANVTVLYLCPFLLTIWLKQPQLFSPSLYTLSAASSIIMSTKEHKFQFQFSTNTHQKLARFMFGTYTALVGVWLFFIPHFGLPGLLWCWLAVEAMQLGYLTSLNARLFAHYEPRSNQHLVSLATLSAIFLAGAHGLLPYTRQLLLPLQVGIGVANGALLFGLAIPFYHLGPVLTEFLARRKGSRLA